MSLWWMYNCVQVVRYSKEGTEQKQHTSLMVVFECLHIISSICTFGFGILNMLRSVMRKKRERRFVWVFVYWWAQQAQTCNRCLPTFGAYVISFGDTEVVHGWPVCSFENSVFWVFCMEMRRRLPHRTMYMYRGAGANIHTALQCFGLVRMTFDFEKQEPDMIEWVVDFENLTFWALCWNRRRRPLDRILYIS